MMSDSETNRPMTEEERIKLLNEVIREAFRRLGDTQGCGNQEKSRSIKIQFQHGFIY
jgi:hypothetical protein